ncbi:MAG: hypothetical protein ABIZ80_09570 [Bryobacteraceae bacterium]
MRNTLHKIGSFISTTLGILFLVGLLALGLVPSIAVEYSGAELPGEILKKTEDLSIDSDGSWNQRYVLTVRFRYPGSTYSDMWWIAGKSIEVDSALFDSLPLGSHVRIRTLATPFAPARLAQQGRFGKLRPLLESQIVRFLITLVLGVVLGMMGWRRRESFPLILWMACLYAAGWAVYWISPLSDRVPKGSVVSAEARVLKIVKVDRVAESDGDGGFSAIQNYLVVAFEFTPGGRAEPVKAFDRIDEASVAGLVDQGKIAIVYEPGRPRWAQIQGGRRTYWWKNPFFFAPYALGVAAAWLLYHFVLRRLWKLWWESLSR